MDSLTQAVLGAAVGEAVAGPRVGRRAALWGAVAGTLPDLDVLAYPWLDTAAELHVHRGLTHGLAFSFVAGPVLGWAVWRFERWRAGRSPDRPGGLRPARSAGTWRLWTAVWFAALLTHPLLDVFTVYGTQLLAPFSDRPFAVGSVFIVDPLYTVPLAGFLLAALVTRRPGRRRVWAGWGLAVSTAYLAWGLVAQQAAHRAALRALDAEGVRPARVLTAAAPLTTLLWRSVAEVETDSGTVYLTGLRSLLDDGPDMTFRATAARRNLLAPYAGSRPAETLRWFSRGWLRVRPAPPGADSAGGVVVADVRFGRADGDLGPSRAPYLFTWRLAPAPGAGGVAMEQVPFEADVSAEWLGRLWDRALGRPAPATRPMDAPPAERPSERPGGAAE
ncbi:metal-dependent hydrolase [Rubrivirga sp. S365]|uniref:Metal-dependent hydrolase n=1 Tax=Rubrivirga litoralis TaxID=3075598 RepID=A0ABU3BPC8_9BACT|nr:MULTISPECIES: metal-dependent hydrolase [unclassified Rubrivirga]MDT0631137.1 metal-dependent hydrolase [Rubrivirga sp. F394]MDT7855350.1 metal-dependent hydrolase [Rubrivirga sp. S365]